MKIKIKNYSKSGYCITPKDAYIIVSRICSKVKRYEFDNYIFVSYEGITKVSKMFDTELRYMLTKRFKINKSHYHITPILQHQIL